MEAKTVLRILHVFGCLDRGGAETMIMNLYRNIDRSKIQFDFVVHRAEQGAYEDEIISYGGQIYRAPDYKVINHVQYIFWWKNLFRTHPEYLIVHGHMRSTASIYLKVAESRNLVTIIHSHSTSNGNGMRSIIKNILQLPLRYTADYLFACSDTAGKWLYGKKGIQKGNYRLIKNAIDSEAYRYNKTTREIKRQELGIEDKYAIGVVGRITHPKNPFRILDIFEGVYLKTKDSVLVWAGTGELEKEVKRIVHERKLDGAVVFLGVRNDIPDLLQAFDVFFQPSLWEGLPVALIEAQAAGLPCIISNKISEEAIITELVEQISLKTNNDTWTNKLLEVRKHKISHTDTKSQIIERGYDVKENAFELSAFYFSAIAEKRLKKSFLH